MSLIPGIPDSVTGTLVGGIAGGPAGAAIGAQIGGGIDANEGTKNLTHDQMTFQERMSNTAYQRQKKDLEAAGYNPLLVSASGASTPSGATATMQNVAQGLSATAMDMKRFKLEQEMQQEQISNLKSQRAKTNMETLVLQKDLPKAEFGSDMVELYRKGKKFISDAINDRLTTGAAEDKKLYNTDKAYNKVIKLKTKD